MLDTEESRDALSELHDPNVILLLRYEQIWP